MKTTGTGASAREWLSGHRIGLAVASIVLASGLARLAFMFRAPVFLLHDSGSYFTPAHDLVSGLGFDLSVRRTPLYPAFLATVISLFGEELGSVALAQHVLGMANSLLAFVLARQLFGFAAGVVAGIATAVDGTLLVAEHYVMPEALLVALLLATLILAIRAMRSGTPSRYAATGALLGLCILCKPVAQVLIPVIALVALAAGGPTRRLPSLLAWYLFGIGLVVAPWMVRNLIVHGSATTSGALGQTLLARTAKHDLGFRYFEQGSIESYADPRDIVARRIVQSGINQRLSDGVIYRRVQDQLRLDDVEANSFVRNLAMRVILQQPAYYLQGTARMSWQLLVGEVERLRADWKTQNARLSREEWDDRVEHLLGKPGIWHESEFGTAARVVDVYQPGAFGPLLPCLALGGLIACAARRSTRDGMVVGLSALALIVISAALDGPVARYRYPADPLILVSALGMIAIGASGVSQPGWRRARWQLASSAERAGKAA